MSDIRGRLARGSIWILLARVATNGSAFVGTLVLARLLTPDDFGLVAIATTIAFIIASITELSLSSALIHLKEIDDDHLSTAFTLNMLRSGILGALIAALASPVAWLYGEPRLVAVMIAVSAVILVSGLSNPRMVVFARNLSFRQEALVLGANKVLGVIASITVALVFRSYWAIVAGLAVAQLVSILLSYVMVPFRPRLTLRRAGGLLSYSVWLSLGQAINTLNWKSDHLFIGYMAGNSALGFYTLGDNLAQLPTREATAPLSQTLFPGFAKLRDETERLRRAYRRAQALLCMIALPAGFGLAMVAEPMVLLAIGEKWAPVIPIIQLLGGIFAIQTLASAVQPMALAMGVTRTLFNRDALNFGIRMPLIIGGLLTGGLMGAVYARCVSGVVSTFINMLLARRLLDLPLSTQITDNARTIAATAVMVGGLSLLFDSMPSDPAAFIAVKHLVGMVVTGAGLYIVALAIAWLACGRPEGPERELVQIVTKLASPIANLIARRPGPASSE